MEKSILNLTDIRGHHGLHELAWSFYSHTTHSSASNDQKMYSTEVDPPYLDLEQNP